MITIRAKSTVKIAKASGSNLTAEFGKGQALEDVICNLINCSGIKSDAAAIAQIKMALGEPPKSSHEL